MTKYGSMNIELILVEALRVGHVRFASFFRFLRILPKMYVQKLMGSKLGIILFGV